MAGKLISEITEAAISRLARDLTKKYKLNPKKLPEFKRDWTNSNQPLLDYRFRDRAGFSKRFGPRKKSDKRVIESNDDVRYSAEIIKSLFEKIGQTKNKKVPFEFPWSIAEATKKGNVGLKQLFDAYGINLPNGKNIAGDKIRGAMTQIGVFGKKTKVGKVLTQERMKSIGQPYHGRMPTKEGMRIGAQSVWGARDLDPLSFTLPERFYLQNRFKNPVIGDLGSAYLTQGIAGAKKLQRLLKDEYGPVFWDILQAEKGLDNLVKRGRIPKKYAQQFIDQGLSAEGLPMEVGNILNTEIMSQVNPNLLHSFPTGVLEAGRVGEGILQTKGFPSFSLDVFRNPEKAFYLGPGKMNFELKSIEKEIGRRILEQGKLNQYQKEFYHESLSPLLIVVFLIFYENQFQ